MPARFPKYIMQRELIVILTCINNHRVMQTPCSLYLCTAHHILLCSRSIKMPLHFGVETIEVLLMAGYVQFKSKTCLWVLVTLGTRVQSCRLYNLQEWSSLMHSCPHTTCSDIFFTHQIFHTQFNLIGKWTDRHYFQENIFKIVRQSRSSSGQGDSKPKSFLVCL